MKIGNMDEIKKMQKQIDNLTIKSEGIELEYQYVNELKNKKIEKLESELELKESELKEKQETIEYYKKEFEQVVKKMEEYKLENEAIKSSKWWKLREKLKGGKNSG